MTITALSLVARKARLTALRDLIDIGGGGGIQFYEGSDVPASPETAATDLLLGEIPLADPCGTIGDSGGLATLTLSVPRTVTAVATGVIGWARFVDGAGVAHCDRVAVAAGSAGAVVVTELQVYLGGEMQLLSCVISE
jgi:hypothetical protein